MTVGDTIPFQVEVATQEVIIILTSKTLMETSGIRELIVQLALVLLGGTSHHFLLMRASLLPL